jgi:antirestriction protein ArdC
MSSTYQRVTDSIVKSIESAGGESLPWRKPWQVPAPCNFETGRAYRGINRLVLECCHEFEDHRWLTFAQVVKLGGTIRKGSKSTPVVLWKESPKDDENDRRLLCRTLNVFNVEQILGLPISASVAEQIPLLTGVERAQEVMDGYKDCPHIRHGGNVACYSLSKDEIRMPRPGHFASKEDYFATLFHEASHSCGASHRLDRITLRRLGDSHCFRALEELIAELSSAFLCSEAGIYAESQHAAYLQSWLKCFRDDASFIVRASSAAQRATDYILGRYQKPNLVEAVRILGEHREALALA